MCSITGEINKLQRENIMQYYQTTFREALFLGSKLHGSSMFACFSYMYFLHVFNEIKHDFLTYFYTYVLFCFEMGLLCALKWCNTVCFTETPDSFDKRTLYWLQQTRSHRDHYFHCYDEVCQVASNY